MADEGEYRGRLHPDDMAALMSAMQRGVAHGPPYKPPVFAQGEDARVWQEMLERTLTRHGDTLLTKCHDAIWELFADLGMPVGTPDEKRKTARKLDNLFQLQEAAHTWRSEFFSTIVKASAGWGAGLITAAIGYAIAKGGMH